MTLQACAEFVRKGDPDRFRAVMAAPPAAREKLFPIYAMNVEVSRAPWVTQEPLIAEMRLQWWRDALDEIASGGPVRRHEVVTPLTEVLDAEGARLLDGVVVARRWDIAREPFVDTAALIRHLEATAGTLMWVAGRALGSDQEAPLRKIGTAGGVANWLVSVPSLKAHGLQPLPDESDSGIVALAREGQKLLSRVRGPGRIAALSASEAQPVLQRAIRDPGLVAGAALERPQAVRSARLLRLAMIGR
ncbi:squalene/phytoene synthase family protein [Palleronia caenipelagi]|uniref:Phytoene synthase n=1 Tax=Palleronia caenipelagi TaxID=2489174 RepID=A0A547PXX0_9RHOB|nr:squalene/phytoene synthase family protein [Palleronia caenipelagi]TRD18949.1 phytoene synthase [Palleronia caenipelagi]